MQTVLNILTIFALLPWIGMCMMSPMSLAAQGAYEKQNIQIGLILSYPIIIFCLYWLFDAQLFSITGLTLLRWGGVIVGIPVCLIVFNALKSLAKSSRENVVLFSPLEGILTFKGKPAAGAKITRWITLREDKHIEDIFFANDNGEFNLPMKCDIVRISPMAKLAIRQIIEVEYNHKHSSIWGLHKYSKDLYGELGGKPLNLTCELTDSHTDIALTKGSLHTSCQWDSIAVMTNKEDK